MDDMSNAVIDLLSGRATVDDVAGRLERVEQELIAGITGGLGSAPATDRERQLEAENRMLREALIREATLRAELLQQRRLSRVPRAPRRARRRRVVRGLRHRRRS